MKKKTKTKIEIGFVFMLILALSGYLEFTNSSLTDGKKLARSPTGEGEDEVALILNAEDVLKDYPYSLLVEEVVPTQEEAEKYFEQAKEEIGKTFCKEGEDVSHVTEFVNPMESYAGGLVEAQWYFDHSEFVDPDGEIIEEALNDEGIPVCAEVELSCKGYQEIYTFPFMIYPRSKTEEETLLEAIRKDISAQQMKEGTETLILPEEVNGVSLSWSNAKDHLMLKVFLLEMLILVLIPIWKREKKKKEEAERNKRLLLDYPGMVSKLTILVGSGMTVKQAWNKISAQYLDKREKKQTKERPVYEEMLRTNREIQGGESERIAYQKFGERTGIHAYHRFVRILVQNLQKGSRGLCGLLEQESETAFEERRMLAKKLGEEAGTKMLLPLILMMAIVMAIVLMPAIIGFIG